MEPMPGKYARVFTRSFIELSGDGIESCLISANVGNVTDAGVKE
jgi:hypothetical protein